MLRTPQNSQITLERILIQNAMNPITQTRFTRRLNQGGSISGTNKMGQKFTQNYAASGYDPAQTRGMNSGGTITRGGLTSSYSPSAYDPSSKPTPPPAAIAPMPQSASSTPPSMSPGRALGSGPQVSQPGIQPLQNMNSGGSMTKAGGITRAYSPTPYFGGSGIKAIAPAPKGPAQTETANPLTGSKTNQMPGTTQPLNEVSDEDPNAIYQTADEAIKGPPSAGSAMGYSSRGTSVPTGQDVIPGKSSKSGLSQNKFTDPKSKNPYDDYVRGLLTGS